MIDKTLKSVANHGYIDRTLKTMINYEKITIDKRNHENHGHPLLTIKKHSDYTTNLTFTMEKMII
jgi:hypothetical protein